MPLWPYICWFELTSKTCPRRRRCLCFSRRSSGIGFLRHRGRLKDRLLVPRRFESGPDPILRRKNWSSGSMRREFASMRACIPFRSSGRPVSHTLFKCVARSGHNRGTKIANRSTEMNQNFCILEDWVWYPAKKVKKYFIDTVVTSPSNSPMV